MSTTTSLLRRILGPVMAIAVLSALPKASAVDALLLQDTYVDSTSNKASTNYGTSGDLRVSKSGTTVMRAFLKFSTATLPPGTTAADVEQARLTLWVNSSSLTTGSITLTPVTAAWSESALTHNTAASLTYGLPKHANLVVSSIGQFVSIDVTDWVQAWLAGTLVNQGFIIETGTNSASLNLYFDSKESTLTSHEPQLDISLIGPPGPQGLQGPTGSQGPQGLQGLTGPAGASGPAGPAGPIGPTGLTGATGPQGSPGIPGPEGRSSGIAWSYSTSTDTSPPFGAVRFNNTNLGLATQMYISRSDNWGSWQDSEITRWDDGPSGVLYIRDLLLGRSQEFAITGQISANGDWYTVPIARVGGFGSWSDLQEVSIIFVPKGDTGVAGANGSPGPAGPIGPVGPTGATGPQGTSGAQGSQGPAGAPGATGPQGLQGPQGPQGQAADLAGNDYNWTTDTTDSWLENGDIRLNAPTGEGFIYLSDADVHGADQEIFVETMLESTNPVKGYFVAVRPDNPRWMKIFAVTSGVEAGGYYRLGVLRVVEVGGTWPNNTAVKLTFIRNGDKGDKGDTGNTGPTGPAGAIGQTGVPGPQGPIGPAGVPGATGATGPQGPEGVAGPIGPAGATGATGPQGQAADLAGNDYNWTTDTTDSWLENGDIRLNAPTGEGFIYLSDADVHGADQEIFVETMLESTNPVKGYFVAVRPDNPRWMKIFAVTSGAEAGGYYRLGVLRVVEVGGTWPNNTPVKLTFIRNGDKGDKGDAGAAGAQGAMGPAGPIGPKGDTGAAGATGDAGPIGPMGVQGPIGPMGLQGIEGPQGIAGTDGAKWYSWSGSPVQALGVLGDYYLDVVTGDVWQKVPNEGGPEWAVQGNIRGADGAVGAKGENGDTGPIGPQGPAGPAGLTGPLGPVGPQGPVGPGGDPGGAGPAGPQGPPGPVLTRVDAQGDLSMGEFTQGPTP
jgi:Collagen triple helix repeat (20 copies)